jgi:hypothetical protein
MNLMPVLPCESLIPPLVVLVYVFQFNTVK